MRTGLADFDRILFTDLRPAHLEGKPQDWFTHMISELRNEPLNFKVLWEVEYIFALNSMAKFYKILIDRQYNLYYNHFCTQMLEAGSELEKSFLLVISLDELIGVKMKETAREIASSRINSDVLQEGKPGRQEKPIEWETAYILYYLKSKLTVLYLNIQDRYLEFLNDDRLTTTQLELTYFRQIHSGPGIIRIAEAGHQPIESADVIPANTAFASMRFPSIEEQRNENFNPIVKQTQFDEIVKRLKEYGILDSQGCFVNSKKKSHKTLLSSVYQVMIDCEFFRKHDLDTKQRLKNTDIRNFLDKHFKVDLKETFRKITPADVELAKIKLPWLDRVR